MMEFLKKLMMAGLWSCTGAPIGFLICLIYVIAGVSIPVFPPLIMLWCVGIVFGLAALPNSFKDPEEILNPLWMSIALGTIGSVIGGIVGSFLLPGFGTLLGLTIGSLAGAGIGVSFATIAYFITGLFQKCCGAQKEEEISCSDLLIELAEANNSTNTPQNDYPPSAKLFNKEAPSQKSQPTSGIGLNHNT